MNVLKQHNKSLYEKLQKVNRQIGAKVMKELNDPENLKERMRKSLEEMGESYSAYEWNQIKAQKLRSYCNR